MNTLYRLIHTSKLDGVDTIIAENVDISTLRNEAAIFLLKYNSNYGKFFIIEKGRQWELKEPDICRTCPKEAGILTISEMISELNNDNVFIWSNTWLKH